MTVKHSATACLSVLAMVLASMTIAGTAHASVSVAAVPDSQGVSISASGRYVAFASLAQNLVPGDHNNFSDIFVRDRVAGTTTLVSVSSAGAQGDSDSQNAVMSGDGHFVIFESHADNLVAGDTNGGADLFIRDLVHHTTQRVDVSTDGAQSATAAFDTFDASVSANGRYVAFSSTLSTFAAGDTNNVEDIFVRDTVAHTTKRVSVSASGNLATNASYEPSISGNGRYVAFTSDAHNLVPGDTNPFTEVLIKDLHTGTVSIVSVASDGAVANNDSFAPSVSDSGRYVAFDAGATNLVTQPVSDDETAVYVRDRTAKKTTLVAAATGTFPNDLAFPTKISGDGHDVAFLRESVAPPPIEITQLDVYRRDLTTATTTHVASLGEMIAFGMQQLPAISDDGGIVGFISRQANLVGNDTNHAADVFVEAVAGSTVTRASVADDGAQAEACFWSVNDSIVGMPTYANGAGGVDVQTDSNGNRVLTRASIGAGASTTSDRFGAAVATDDLQNTFGAAPTAGNKGSNGGCPSVVIGAPGADGTGKVFIAFSSPTGVGAAGDVATLADPNAAPGDEFGSSVLIVRPQLTSVSDIYVGAPGKDVGTAVDAGAIEHFRVSYPADADHATVTYIGTITQNSPGVVGTAEAGDRFGEVLASVPGWLGVGVPHEDVGTAVDAGMVDVIPLSGTKGFVGVTQNTLGMPGTAEAGDAFGAAVNLSSSFTGGCTVTVGVPGEDIGHIRDAGVAESFRACQKAFQPGKLIDQNTKGIPGTAEAGDRFGASVTFNDDPTVGAIYGIPGESIGSVPGAGAILTIPYGCPDNAPPSCPAPRSIWQGHGAPGAPQANAHFGTSIATLFALGDGDDPNFDGEFFGAPGENVDGVAGAGAVYDGLFFEAAQISLSTGPQAGLGYGAIIGPNASAELNVG